MRHGITGVLWGSVGSFVALILGAIVTKIVAMVGGPAGIALYAQFRQLIQWWITASTWQGHGSIARGLSIRAHENRAEFLYVVFWVYVIGTVVAILLFLAFAAPIEKFIFGDTVKIAGSSLPVVVAIILGAISSYVTGVVIGVGRVRTLVGMQVSGALVAVAVSYPLVRSGLPLAYVGIVAATYCGSVAVGLFALVSADKVMIKTVKFKRPLLIEHLSYASLSVASVLMTAGTLVFVRSMYIRMGGLTEAGLIEASLVISGLVSVLLLGPVENFWFPKLCNAVGSGQRPPHFLPNLLKWTILGGAAIVSVAILFKPTFIELFFSRRFLPAIEIMSWMLLGEFCRITAWVPRMYMLATGDRRAVLFADCLASILVIVVVTFCIEMTWHAVGIGFFVGNLAAMTFILMRFRTGSGPRILVHAKGPWITSLFLLGILSFLFWRAQDMSIASGVIALCLTMTILFMASGLHKNLLRWLRGPA